MSEEKVNYLKRREDLCKRIEEDSVIIVASSCLSTIISFLPSTSLYWGRGDITHDQKLIPPYHKQLCYQY